MDVRGGAEAQGGDVEGLQQVEHLHDVRPATAGGGHRNDLVAAVSAAHGRPVVNLVFAQVTLGDEAPVSRHLRGNGLAEGTVVKRVGTVRCDQLQARRKLLHDDDVAGRGHRAGRQEEGRGGGERGEVVLIVPYAVDQVAAGGESPPRVANGRLHDRVQAQAPVLARYLAPRLEIARHADREMAELVPAAGRLHVVGPVVGHGLEHVGRGAARGGGVVVDHGRLAGSAVMDVDETGSERAHHHRLDDAQCEHGSHRRVDGIAAECQHLGAGGRSQGMIGRDHAARCHAAPLVEVERRSRTVAPRSPHRRTHTHRSHAAVACPGSDPPLPRS